MLVNKTVEFFLSEVVRRSRRSAVAGGGLGARCWWGPGLGLDEMPTTKSPGQAAGKMPRQRPRWGRRRKNHRGRQRARSEMPAGRNRVAAGRDGSEQMLGRGRRRGCRGWARQWAGEMPAGAEAGTGRDADDQITGAGREQINSKESAL